MGIGYEISGTDVFQLLRELCYPLIDSDLQMDLEYSARSGAKLHAPLWP